VPPDEHPWIESFGATRLYRRFRTAVRDYYRRHYPLTADARAAEHLNPGNGRVSPLCHEPRVALAVLQEVLAPYVSSRRLTRHRPVAASWGDGEGAADGPGRGPPPESCRRAGCGKSACPDLWEPRTGNRPGRPGRARGTRSVSQNIRV